MKRNCLIKLTPEQFEKLYKGLHGRYRFYLNLSFETVVYDPKTYLLTIHFPPSDHDLSERVSTYINGFACAIDP